MDPGKIRVARRTALAVPNTTFVLGNLLDMEYPEAEAVILVDTLHYWSQDKQRDIIVKACDALRPGGVLVFRDAHEASGWRHRLTRWAECLTTAIGHNRRGDGLYFFGEDFYLRAFESSGLVLQDRPRNMGRGSNQVLILRKNM